MLRLPSNVQPLLKHAPAKINLFLRITGRNADGYHLLESLVVFTEYGDEIFVQEDDELCLEVRGEFASGLSGFSKENNLVWKAASALKDYVLKTSGRNCGAKIILTKNLPIASGIGGGSADAAAAIHALCELWNIDITHEDLLEIALKLGSDVPVCLQGKPALMRGIGEDITEIELSHKPYMVLVNPNIPLATADVFRDFAKSYDPSSHNIKNSDIASIDNIIREKYYVNDLENAAVGRLPVIGEIIKSLRSTDGCLLAGMSGSGATCFALYHEKKYADKAAEDLQKIYKNAWCVSTRIKTR